MDNYVISSEKYAEVLAKIPGVELKPGFFVTVGVTFTKSDLKNIDKTGLNE